MDDAGVRRHDEEVVERALTPAEKGVALVVPLELELDVAPDREPGGELVDLHRVVDHELDRDQRVDRLRIAALVAHGIAHRRQVDDAGDAREVLQQDARRSERDLARRLRVGDPVRDGGGTLLRAVPEDVLEQDPERVREPDGGGVEPVEPVALVADP